MANCFRCGAQLKDTAKVCTKCGFIMKGAKLREEQPVEDVTTPAVAVQVAAEKPAKKAVKKEVQKEVQPKQKDKALFWAKFSLWSGIIACTVGMVLPGFNICIAAVAFVCSFIGLGKCSGAGNTLAIVGIALSVVALFGGWAYNVYVGPMIGQMLGTVSVY